MNKIKEKQLFEKFIKDFKEKHFTYETLPYKIIKIFENESIAFLLEINNKSYILNIFHSEFLDSYEVSLRETLTSAPPFSNKLFLLVIGKEKDLYNDIFQLYGDAKYTQQGQLYTFLKDYYE